MHQSLGFIIQNIDTSIERSSIALTVLNIGGVSIGSF